MFYMPKYRKFRDAWTYFHVSKKLLTEEKNYFEM